MDIRGFTDWVAEVERLEAEKERVSNALRKRLRASGMGDISTQHTLDNEKLISDLNIMIERASRKAIMYGIGALLHKR